MNDEPCIHDLDPATCSICNGSRSARASRDALNFAAIRRAVEDLAARGEFRTIDVAEHPEVRAAHPQMRRDPQFNQHIGMYLTDATARLDISQVSRKGQSNATWQRR